LEKSKIKYFSYYFAILPLVLGIIYISIEYFVIYILINNNKYDTIFTILSCFLLSFITLILSLCFRQKNQFIRDFSQYVIIFYISCLLSFILYFVRFNLGITHHCAYAFDISYVKNIYNLTIIFTTITNVIFFYIFKYYKLKFKQLHIAVFILAMLAQFFFTRGFRMI